MGSYVLNQLCVRIFFSLAVAYQSKLLKATMVGLPRHQNNNHFIGLVFLLVLCPFSKGTCNPLFILLNICWHYHKYPRLEKRDFSHFEMSTESFTYQNVKICNQAVAQGKVPRLKLQLLHLPLCCNVVYRPCDNGLSQTLNWTVNTKEQDWVIKRCLYKQKTKSVDLSPSSNTF